MIRLSALLLLVGSFHVHGDVLVTNARLVTPTSILGNVDILVRDGRISAVGEEMSHDKPGDVEVVDAEDRFVTPGLFDSGTQFGLAEVEYVTESTDNSVSKINLSAGFELALALNRHSSLIPTALGGGVTRAVIMPQVGTNIFAGTSALVQLGGDQPFAYRARNAVHLHLGEEHREHAGGSRASALLLALDAFREAKRYAGNRRDYERGSIRAFDLSKADLEMLARVISGELPLVVHADRAADIEIILDQLDEFNFDLILAGGAEAWKVRDRLAAEDIPVIINVLDNRPSSFDRFGARLDNAALLDEAGVAVAFMSIEPFAEYRSLAQAAGVAVAHGMSWQSAINAITKNPAEIWLDGELGRVEKGAVADLVIWDGDPLEVMSAPVRVMIAGQWVDISNRQELLRDRYRDLSTDQPFGYR